MRKGHRKSRFGCKTCRERKVKCDETRPSCHRCSVAGRTCVYLRSAPPPSASSSASRASSADSPITSSLSHLLFHSSSADAGHAPEPVLPECYSLLHLELLHHFTHNLRSVTQWAHPDVERIFGLVYQEAFHTPYLMDEMLAIAAAHKSTLPGDHVGYYRTEATRLQTRALSNFTRAQAQVQAQANVDDAADGNGLKCFAFSCLLGQHVLFDIFSSTSDVPTILDRVIQCIDLNRGIRSLCSQSWDEVHQFVDGRHFVTNTSILAGTHTDEAPGPECAALLDRLTRSEAVDATREVCADATRILQYLFDTLRSSHIRRVLLIQEWPIRMSRKFIDLLHERRPEALVVLAHYAVLLHYARDYWAAGDSGRALIDAISRHLGTYWEEWLAWPNQALEEP